LGHLTVVFAGAYTLNDGDTVPWSRISDAPVLWLKGWNEDIVLKDPSRMTGPEVLALYKYLLQKGMNDGEKMEWTTPEVGDGHQVIEPIKGDDERSEVVEDVDGDDEANAGDGQDGEGWEGMEPVKGEELSSMIIGEVGGDEEADAGDGEDGEGLDGLEHWDEEINQGSEKGKKRNIKETGMSFEKPPSKRAKVTKKFYETR